MKAPLSDTAHTLISQHGWRTDVIRQGSMTVLRRWCPTCWAHRRERERGRVMDDRGKRSA